MTSQGLYVMVDTPWGVPNLARLLLLYIQNTPMPTLPH